MKCLVGEKQEEYMCVKKKELDIFMRRIKKLARLECPTSMSGREKKRKGND